MQQAFEVHRVERDSVELDSSQVDEANFEVLHGEVVLVDLVDLVLAEVSKWEADEFWANRAELLHGFLENCQLGKLLGLQLEIAQGLWFYGFDNQMLWIVLVHFEIHKFKTPGKHVQIFGHNVLAWIHALKGDQIMLKFSDASENDWEFQQILETLIIQTQISFKYIR